MRKKSILLIDDDKCKRLLYREALSDEGYNITMAENGKEAMEKVENKQPDLVILDIDIPKMQGLKAFSQILRKSSNMLVILNNNKTELRHTIEELLSAS